MIQISSRSMSWIVVVAIFAVDFFSKRWVLSHQAEFLGGIDLIDGLLRFTYVRNSGAAFGMLQEIQGGRWILAAVSVAAVLGLSWFVSLASTRGLKRVASTMILAGAAGNLVDRLAYDGRVVDFIEMGFQGHSFPVYNVADIGVSIGAVVLVLSLILERDGDPSAASRANEVLEGESDGARD